MRPRPSVDALVEGVIAGDRASIARAITLVESTLAEDVLSAESLVERIYPRTGAALRIGISGAPGVGKSTFIDALGTQLVGAGKRISVLAVDPSSAISGGSILADKTRMGRLAAEPRAFIRPSPSARSLGGVARRTREAMLVCESAGNEIVIVETVGVGQSEIEVSEMVDVFLLLVSPGAGDELQGIKRGIVECADFVVVTRADGATADLARRTARDYGAALGYLRPRTSVAPCALSVSSTEGSGLEDVWAAVRERDEALIASGERQALRHAQSERFVWKRVEEYWLEAFLGDDVVSAALPSAMAEVARGALSPTGAARRLIELSHRERATHADGD